MRDMVVLINLDGRASRSMARKLRAEGVYCKVLPADTGVEELLAQEMLGVMLVGGESGEPAHYPQVEKLLAADLPVLAMGDAALGLCLALGGSLGEKADAPHVVQVRYSGDAKLLDEVLDGERYLPACRYMAPPASGNSLALGEGGILGFRAGDKPVYALAFQTENNDPDGTRLLLNFCREVCGCTLWWSDQAFVERAVQELERCAGDGEALCALSGGVDSGVSAVLGNLAIGGRLHCIFVDTGLLRKGEADRVMAFFRDEIGLEVKRIDAQAEFLSALADVVDPAEKERIIFALLRAIIRREMAQYPNVRMIIQGTNYSDTLDAEPPMQLENQGAHVRIAEPVRELFKDEIRHAAEELRMPAAICRRQPFPGSGLALRIMQAVTPERLEILREADAIFREEIEQAGQGKRLWQYYATLSEDPVPGVDGCIITLRAIQAAEGGVGVAARLPVDLTERTSERILALLPRVHRVLYDLTPSRTYAQYGWR